MVAGHAHHLAARAGPGHAEAVGLPLDDEHGDAGAVELVLAAHPLRRDQRVVGLRREAVDGGSAALALERPVLVLAHHAQSLAVDSEWWSSIPS